MALGLDPMPQIWGVTGNLGGGKTLTAVNLAVNSMLNGYLVVSNVRLNLDRLSAVYGDWIRRLYLHFDFDDPDFHPEKLPCGSPRGTKGGKRVLVVMDECAEWVDQYTTAKDPRIKQFWSWLRHTSKQSQDVILIVQRLEYLNKVLRLLISKWVIVDDLLTYRLPILKCRIPFCGGFVMQRVFDRNRRLVQGPCFCRKKTWGRYYDTAQCLNAAVAQGRNEYGVPQLYENPWKFAFIAVVVALSFVVVCVYAREHRHVSPLLAMKDPLFLEVAARQSRQKKAGVAETANRFHADGAATGRSEVPPAVLRIPQAEYQRRQPR